MVQQNEMSARALTMEEMENVNGGIPSLMRQILKYFLIFFGGFRKTLYLCNQLIDKSNTRESDNPYQVH